MFAVERSEGFECRGEDPEWERDFWFGRCERVASTNGSFVESDREALLDVTFPKEFENLVGVGRKCKGGCGCGTVIFHNSFVVGHFDRIMFLDAVYEDLVNPFQLIFP